MGEDENEGEGGQMGVEDEDTQCPDIHGIEGSGIEGIGVDFEVDVDQWASQYARRVGRVLQCLALQSTWSVCGVERETSAGGRLREVYSQLEDDRNLWRLVPMLVP